MKNSKGITLIALIITIVVLIIISGVAISIVQESNIIKKAQEATKTYKEREEEEKAILEGYMSMLEGNVPDAEPETASIVGTYGDTTSSEPEYIEFKEDGIGELVHYDNSKNEKVVEKFTYILNDDGTGTVTSEDNEVAEFKHEVKKDSNGEIINKIVYFGKYTLAWDGDTYNGREITFFVAVLTTNGTNGIEKPNKTYEAVDSGNLAEVSFNGGEATIKYKDGTEEILSDIIAIKCDNIIYGGRTDKEGCYYSEFIIWDDTKIETLGS